MAGYYSQDNGGRLVVGSPVPTEPKKPVQGNLDRLVTRRPPELEPKQNDTV